MPILSASEICAAPPGAAEAVIQGLSLDLKRGEWLAVSGPNGGGKTTLALALAGLWGVRSGRLSFSGREWEPSGPGADRSRIAVILQDPAPQIFTTSVKDELAHSARNLGQDAADIERGIARWTARLGLGAELGRNPRDLSAGRQQLVLLASAFITRPSLLIADEPAVHLDRQAHARVLAAVREEVTGGLAVVWVTQDERERAAADRSLWLGETRAPLSARVEPPAPAGEPALRLGVRPWNGYEEPSVRTSRRLEINIPNRGVVILTGPNGSGKSVILSAACGIAALPQIQVEWATRPTLAPLLVSQYPDQQIFEEQVAEELAYAAVSRGLSRPEALAKAEASLQKLDLSPSRFMERRCWWLSGGERRLVEVVAGLIAPASILALDEPTAGLDEARRGLLFELVRERARAGPVLIASQDAGWIARLQANCVSLGDGLS